MSECERHTIYRYTECKISSMEYIIIFSILRDGKIQIAVLIKGNN